MRRDKRAGAAIRYMPKISDGEPIRFRSRLCPAGWGKFFTASGKPPHYEWLKIKCSKRIPSRNYG